jgi:hypothetical protein
MFAKFSGLWERKREVRSFGRRLRLFLLREFFEVLLSVVDTRTSFEFNAVSSWY